MILTRLSLVLAGALLVARAALGHGDPFVISVPSGSEGLATDARVRESHLELTLGVLSTDTPGFLVESPSAGVPSGAMLAVQAVGKLWYSDGAAIVDTPASLLIENFFADSLVVDNDTTSTGALIVGAYDGQPGWHEDLVYTLQPSASAMGAYAIAIQIIAQNQPSLAASATVAIVLNNGLLDATFDELVVPLAAHALAMPGDVNFDGVVDIFDVNVVSANWSSTGPLGDANHDHMVDIFDVNVISSHWGDNVLDPGAGGAAAVPEPAACTLLALAAALLAALRWRQAAGT